MYHGPYTDVENGYIAVAITGLVIFVSGTVMYFDPGFFSTAGHQRTPSTIYGSLTVMIVGLLFVIGAWWWEDKMHSDLK